MVRDLEREIQLFSSPFIEARYSAVQRELKVFKGMPFASPEKRVESLCFDDTKREFVTGKFDVYLFGEPKYSGKVKSGRKTHIIELKVSDPELYERLGIGVMKGYSEGSVFFNTLQTSLYRFMEFGRFSDDDRPEISAELLELKHGNEPVSVEVGNFYADTLGKQAFKDVVALRKLGPEEFVKRLREDERATGKRRNIWN